MANVSENMTKRIERREFLTACAAVSATAVMGSGGVALGQQAGFVNANLQLDPDASSQRVIGEFLGLSFDASLIPGGAFFNGGNRALIDYVRGLGRGVLQLGGPNLDRTTYSPDDLTKLADFANAVDWRLMLGLSGATDFSVADQAAKAAQALGQRLIAFEIGDAPDLTYRDYGSFLSAFRSRAATIVANVPGAMFAGPSTASHTDWAARFAQDERPQLAALTQQYLHTGGETSLRYGVRRLGQTAASADLPLRLERIVSTSGDNLANALWAIDFAFEMAAVGAEGAHFYDDAQAQSRPLYLALQVFKESVNARFVQPHLQTKNPNFSAWAVERDDKTRIVTLLNRDSNIGATVTLDPGRPARAPRVRRLTGLSMETSQVNVVDWRATELSALDVPPASAALIVL